VIFKILSATVLAVNFWPSDN